jgi:hypothetical protein
MTQLTFANNASTTLAAAIGTGSTTLSVAAGTGAIFPTIANGQSFKITLSPASGSSPAPEIMLVTATSTDTFTVVRAQESTAAESWGVGSIVQNLLTAQTMSVLGQVVSYAGNPNGSVAGYAATSTASPSLCLDTTHNVMYFCSVSGNASTAQWIGLAPLASPTFTGTPAAPTAAPGVSSTQLATTAFVANSFAPLASPTLTGTPTTPTALAGANNTQIANTAFVAASYAPLNSPALVGTPTAPTAASNTSSTQIATTAFVNPSSSFSASGYITMANGMIFQWGYLSYPSGTSSFNITFPNGVFAVFASNADAQGGYVDNAYAYPLSNSQFFAECKSSSLGTLTHFPIYWFAIGY